MNDEQQLWKDAQKFMTQFSGFMAVAKKIGEIGDLAAWRESEQRKLDVVTQERDRQRQVIASERTAADSDMTQRMRDFESRLQESEARLQAAEQTAKQQAASILAQAQEQSVVITEAAKAKAEEIHKASKAALVQKTTLEVDIRALTDKLASLQSEHSAAVSALRAAKEHHAEFVKKITGG